MFLNKIKLRWNDLDANGHLANASYVALMSATRVEYAKSLGFTFVDFKKMMVGPVALREEVHYFKEVFLGAPIYISQELLGSGENHVFYKIRHNFYDSKGNNFARGEMLGAWIDLKTRKLTQLPEKVATKFFEKNKTKDFHYFTKEDTRIDGIKPENIDLTNRLDWFDS